MSFLPRLVLCAALLVAQSGALFAQKRACPVPPPSPFKHSGQIITKLDKAADQMKTTLEHPRPLARDGGSVYLAATFTHQDPRLSGAPTLELALISVAPVEKFRESHALVLMWDGRQRSFVGETSYQSRAVGAGSTLEAATVSLSFEDVQALTRARKVSARLGAAEFRLTNNHLEALREIASLMVPSPSRWRTTE